MLLDNKVGALPKIIEVYMGEAALPTDPTETYLATIVCLGLL